MKLVELITILALFFGPILAIQVSSILDQKRGAKQRKENVFRVLMATRAKALSPEHVQALNMIDVEFYSEGDKDKKAKAVRDSWKVYLDHLYNFPGPDKASLADAWEEKKKDLLTNLLVNMAMCLGYEFDEILIKRAAYFPKAHGDIEMEQIIIRKKLVEILMGSASFPMKLTELPVSDEGRKLNELMAKVYSGETPLKVELKQKDIFDT